MRIEPKIVNGTTTEVEIKGIPVTANRHQVAAEKNDGTAGQLVIWVKPPGGLDYQNTGKSIDLAAPVPFVGTVVCDAIKLVPSGFTAVTGFKVSVVSWMEGG